jgi:hypothetical protein
LVIAARAVGFNQRIVACDEVKAAVGIEMEHSDKPHSFGREVIDLYHEGN